MARKPKAVSTPKPRAKPKPKPAVKAVEMTQAELANLKPTEALMVYASAFRIQGSGNDFNLIFQRATPVQDEGGGLHPSVSILQPTVVVTVSPQSLKDLYVLIGGMLKGHEADFGRIKTPFTIQRSEQKS